MINTKNDLVNLFENDLDVILEIAESPYYLFSERVLRKNWENLVKGFKANWENIAIAYSYKTNPLLGICKTLNDWGAWSEVTSEHEIKISKLVGARNVIFNG